VTGLPGATGDIRDDARAGFVDLTGRQPAGLWSAPGRVNLVGEHTDYNDGFALPFAIDRRTVVAAGLRDDRMLRVASEETDEVVEVPLDRLDTAEPDPEVLSGWSSYPLGVAWALGRSGADLAGLPGADLHIVSTVPVGAGLSSSAAIECSVALALDELWGLGWDRPALARAARLAENEAAGAPTGILDQTAAMLATEGHAVLLDCRDVSTRSVPFDLGSAGLEVLVIDTGVAHALADGGYRSRRESCELGARTLGVAALRDLSPDDLPRARELLDDTTFRRVRHVVTENARVLDVVAALEAGDHARVGELLDASHASLRDDLEVSVPELDLAAETADAEGALGARLVGGGFGGSVIALVPVGAVSRIRVALDGAFAEHGFDPPEVFAVRPSAGAGRDA